MAMNVGGKGGIKSDINVVPLCDIMLVLLIIMILVAPLVQAGANVTLPTARHIGDKPDTQSNTEVLVAADRRFFVDGQEVADAQVVTRILESLERKTERLVYLKGDQSTPYAAIMDMMDRLREAEVEEVALITDPDYSGEEAVGGGE